MEEYGKILVFAMPIFLILIIIEKIYGHYKGEDSSPNMDSVSSVSSGMVNSLKDVLGLSITLVSYDWIASKIALFETSTGFSLAPYNGVPSKSPPSVVKETNLN